MSWNGFFEADNRFLAAETTGCFLLFCNKAGPVFVGFFGWCADGFFSRAEDGFDRAGEERSACAGVVPFYCKGGVRIAEVEVCCAAVGEIDGVDLVLFGEAVIVLGGC